MKNSGTFIRSILSADTNNIVSLVDFNQVLAPYEEFKIENIVEHLILLEDLQVKVALFSLLEAGWPDSNMLATESVQEAALAKIKKEGQKIYLGIYQAYGNGPWIKKGEEILQNKNSLEQPWALMAPLFSTNTTALLDENLKIGVRVEPKAQGSNGLKGTDYLTVFGSWRKVTSITPKKKDDGDIIEDLNSRIKSVNLLAGQASEIAPARMDKSRRGFIVYNLSNTKDALISYGESISQSAYSVKIKPEGYFEDSTSKPGWQGAYWALSTSELTLNITELLAAN